MFRQEGGHNFNPFLEARLLLRGHEGSSGGCWVHEVVGEAEISRWLHTPVAFHIHTQRNNTAHNGCTPASRARLLAANEMQILAVKLWYLVSAPLNCRGERLPRATLDSAKAELQKRSGETACPHPNPPNSPFVSLKVITREKCTVAFALTPSTHAPTCNWVELRHLGSVANATLV